MNITIMMIIEFILLLIVSGIESYIVMFL